MTARARGRMLRGLILLALLLSACSHMPRAFDSTARTMRLTESPIEVVCVRGETRDACVLLLKRDWEALVIAHKAQCLQLGGSPAACQTVTPE